MIRGYFRSIPGEPRPFVTAVVDASIARVRPVEVDFLIDTGSDHTILAPYDAVRLTLDRSRLTPGPTNLGVGGRAETSATRATLTFGDMTIDLELAVLTTPDGARPLPIPSLLGRDVVSRFCLILDQATERVLLLTPEERDRVELPD